jgi:hypothetical protein
MDGGTSWKTQNSGVTNDLYSIDFTDTSTAIVTGANGTILRTTDAGTTWIRQTSGTANTLYGVDFGDTNNGVAVGDNGTILRTTNGGITWMSEPSGMRYSLRSVSFTFNKDTRIVTVVGANGTILRKTEGGVAVRDNSSSKIESPNQISLKQNYPNPFNPITTISFKLSKSAFVTLKVYDLNGEEITTLINESKTAGSYTVNFEASKFSNGVYFYRLYAGGFVQSRKMLLLK